MTGKNKHAVKTHKMIPTVLVSADFHENSVMVLCKTCCHVDLSKFSDGLHVHRRLRSYHIELKTLTTTAFTSDEDEKKVPAPAPVSAPAPNACY